MMTNAGPVKWTGEKLQREEEGLDVSVAPRSAEGNGSDGRAPIPRRRLRASGASARQARRLRLICIEQVHGAAGSSIYGAQQNLWAPAATGRAFDLSPTSLKPLEPFRDHITIVSNCDVPSADPTEAREIGGDHFRSSATYLTQTYPKRTEGADVECGISMDQLYAQRFGQDTPIPSMQLCIENVDQSGGCGYGYSCVYTDTISWASPTKPLPMIRDPRVVFDQMFGVLGQRLGGRSGASAGRRISASSTGCANRRSGSSAGLAPPIACGSPTISTTCARSSAGCRRSRSATTAASRASCRWRREAFPIRSPITSS